VNDESQSGFGCDVGHHGGEGCSPGCDCACRRPPSAEDLAIREAARAGIAGALDGHGQAARVARQARLTRGQWTDAGGGLQVRLA
jgi:hypothetical protein